MSPCQDVTGDKTEAKGDTDVTGGVTETGLRGDIAVSPEPSLTVIKPSIEPERQIPKSKKSAKQDTWDTLMDVLSYTVDMPPANLERIRAGVPVSLVNGILTVQHPEADWASSRFAKQLSRLIQGLCPGGSVIFERSTA